MREARATLSASTAGGPHARPDQDQSSGHGGKAQPGGGARVILGKRGRPVGGAWGRDQTAQSEGEGAETEKEKQHSADSHGRLTNEKRRGARLHALGHS